MKTSNAISRAVRLINALAISAALVLTNFSGFILNRAAAAPLPVAAYNFNEGNGTTVANAAGSNNTGTISGAAWTSSGKNGSALSFDGVNDWVTVNDNSSLDLTNKMTLSAWVRPSAAFNDWSTIVMKERGNGNMSYALYAADGNNQPPAVYGYINGDRSAAGTSVLPQNAWTHVAGTYDGANFKLYVNGALVRTVARTGNMTTSNNPLRIGGNNAWGEFFNGTIDDLRVYNVALTATEIQSDMTTPVGGTPDTTAPSAPTGLAASGITTSQATLSWNAATDDIGVTGYRLLRNDVQIAAPTGLSYVDSGLASGTTYTYKVVAVDAAGNVSALSEVVNVTTQTPQPDFSFTPLQATRTVAPTGSTFYEVDVAYLNGFTSSSIDLWDSGLPAGATGSWLFDPMVHQGRTELLIDTTNVAEGTYTVTLGATDTGGSGITHSQQVTLVVSNVPDFSIGIAPQIQNITAGGLSTFDITIAGSGGFNDPVTFTASGLPTGAGATFSPSTVSGSGNSIMTISTATDTPAGLYNVTVTATSGSLVRTSQVSVNVVASNATWTVATLGSTGTQNNTVRVGKLKGDGQDRIYVGTIGTGRMLEYSWNGSAWSNPVDVGGSPTGQEIHNVTIGQGRGDGQDRIYAASYDNKIYEIWYNGSAWQQQEVATLDNLGMHAAVGDGRNDGVTRLYAASTQKLYEYTWNGTSWVGGVIGNTPGAHGTVVGDGRNDGTNSVFVASISSGSFEARYVNNAWAINSMGDSGDVRDAEVGIGRNDGIKRVYGALLDGRVREYTWTGSNWAIAHTPTASANLIHAYVLAGRNDGTNRLYTSSSDGKSYEFSWNGSSWQSPQNMGGGNDYMYGMHFGFGRNDGIMRLYGADRGSVNRVYEYTWTGSAADTQAPTVPSGLSATPISPTRVDLAWAASTDNVGVVSYTVKRNGTAIAQPTTNSYSDTSALPGQTYAYTVSARDGTGNLSAESGEATATTDNPTDTTPPTTPGNLTSTAQGANQINLTWAASTDNVALASYQVWRDGSQIATTTATSFSDTNLTPSTAYSYYVRAADAAGNVSADSNTAVVTTAAQNSAPGLVAAYGFNEGTGATATDSTGAHNGSIAGATWSTQGRYGNALSFDGAGDMVTAVDANDLDLTTGMTLEAWVRPTSLQGWTTVVMKESSSTMSYSLYASDNTNQPPAGYVQVGGDQAVRGTQSLALNTWSHLAVTYDGSVLRMYINGTLVSSRALTGAMLASTGSLRIGGNSIWGEYFSGLIDDVRVYNRALSQGEVQTDMNTSL